MKVTVCCIAKMENRYIREWVGHYKKIGVDKIIIVDNNDVDGERFEEVIKDYIDDGFVKIIDFRGRERAQFRAFNFVYHYDDSDWIAFFDVDEYLIMNDYDNIKDYLSTFDIDDTDVIKVNWMCYGDCEKLHYEDKPLNERFDKPIEYDSERNANLHVKSIVRGNMFDKMLTYLPTPHVPIGIKLKYKDASNKVTDGHFFQKPDFSHAYLKHFVTKTIEEFVTNKMVRGIPDRSKEKSKQDVNLDLFFSYNKKTDEKVKMAHLLQQESQHKSNLL